MRINPAIPPTIAPINTFRVDPLCTEVDEREFAVEFELALLVGTGLGDDIDVEFEADVVPEPVTAGDPAEVVL